MKKKTKVLVVVPKNTTPAVTIQEAIAKGANLETLKGLLELQERYETNEARKAFHQAMAEFKANPPEIEKDKKVGYKTDRGQVGYSHASLYNVTKKINSALSKYGLSVSWTTRQEDGKVSVTCKITHCKGHSEETTLTAAPDDTGSKNSIQAVGSTITYLERYTLLALTGLATFDMDDDGRSSSKLVEYVDEKQLSQLFDIIDNSKINKVKFLAYLKIEKLENLPKADFQKAQVALQNIIKGGKPC